MSTTNTKHTPGPWRMRTDSTLPEDAGCAIFSGRTWAKFARCYIECDGRPNDEGMANAQLIAQAPTMAARIAELESQLARAIEGNRALTDQLARVTAQRDRLAEDAKQLCDDAETLASHAAETYPHFESERGQDDIAHVHEALADMRAALRACDQEGGVS